MAEEKAEQKTKKKTQKKKKKKVVVVEESDDGDESGSTSSSDPDEEDDEESDDDDAFVFARIVDEVFLSGGRADGGALQRVYLMTFQPQRDGSVHPAYYGVAAVWEEDEDCREVIARWRSENRASDVQTVDVRRKAGRRKAVMARVDAAPVPAPHGQPSAPAAADDRRSKRLRR